ncbi:hypothetical protein [Geoalkalibacter halelectricus]|uniref:hypothetical protein n=1 Tax=Geoalkalibacter halelectricus TaxID=2847045 RepID=UPI002670B2A0|nr:hypothetical protein [Geoalkalibacter halelectricus]MDO3380529.1 hypothetical protein [Geoalkalibacter halelectricus]
MSLASRVQVETRFQRAIRIDTDLSSPESIAGFICPQSSADALLNMVRHIAGTGQCAFTWTGPYGSGKSSLLVALGGLLSDNAKTQNAAEKALGSSTAKEILDSLPRKTKGWKIIPIVGRRAAPAKVIGEALAKEGLIKFNDKQHWSDNQIIEALLEAANFQSQQTGGLIVFIDEMGKILEGAASDNSDIFFFQQLAETASRSNNRLIVIGVLHQAFGEYAHRLSRDMRDEWSKIQGRFIDLPINVAGEEQIDLLSRAIISDGKPKVPTRISEQVAAIISKNKQSISNGFGLLLDRCWPLHPIVACLLGPISRRRFGQNQRSLFGFLNSAEPSAFRSFLEFAGEGDLYTTDHLWNYLRINLEPTILTSPDGHRWALAVDAVERCEAQVNQGLHLTLLKAIALIDMFKGGSGLVPSEDLLVASFPNYSTEDILRSLEQLRRWSFVIFKKHLDAYAIYAGSDFDIDAAVAKAREEIRTIDFKSLKRLAGLQPILAKRHYHNTGVLRWFEVDLVPINLVIESAQKFSLDNGAIGQFLLAVSTEGETEDFGRKTCIEAAKASDRDVIVGLSKQSWSINSLALEILALEKVYDESAELAGDSVARREIRANLAELQSRLEAELNRAFDHANWYAKDGTANELTRKELSVLASNIADEYYRASPKIHNELLNRVKPSSNAIAAQNALLRQMVIGEGIPRLGIEGFPAEGGLFSSILENTGLYDSATGIFRAPSEITNDPGCLQPAWVAATEYLKKHSERAVSVSEIYAVWQRPPYGIREGLMPVLAVAYILSQRSILAFYRDGIFQSRLRDIDVEVLAKKPADIQLRYMDLSEVSKKLLSGMADIVRELDETNVLKNLEPIDVARGLIAIYDNIHPWAQRTMHLTREAVRIRNLFKKANDPNKLLFNDIPGLLDTEVALENEQSVTAVIDFIYQGLKQLKEAYPTEINRLREIMLAELQVPNCSSQAMAALRQRAENIKDVSGDFRLEAFVVRLAAFTGTDEDIEGIASLATNKPPRNWIDNDIDRAKVEITALAQNFIRTESYARVKGRADKRHSLAVVVGINGRPTPIHQDFEVTDDDREQIDQIIGKLGKIIKGKNQVSRNVVLAALVEICAEFIRDNAEETSDNDKAAS